jgi:outer membrane protein TolC
VTHASLANLLDRERAALADRPDRPAVLKLFASHGDERAHRLRLAVLGLAAREDRNRSAGAALELYFRLAEAEAQADLLDRTRADLADALRRSEDLFSKGFRVPVDRTALRRQQLDAEADRTRLHAALVELNGRLKGLTGLEDLPPDDWLWPAVDGPPRFEPVDADAAVSVALALRPELVLLRTVSRELDGKTLPVIRDYLKTLSGLLGHHPEPAKKLEAAFEAVRALLTAHAAERALRGGQVQQLLAERERAVAEEVRRAAANLGTKARLAAISRDRVLNAEARRKEVDDQARRGTASYLEVLTANLEWYKARGQLVSDVAAWHTAAVQLRQAQGLLVLDCLPDCTPPH